MRSRQLLLPLAILSLAVGGTLWWISQRSSEPEPSASVETPQSQAVEAVAALGQLEPAGEVRRLAAPSVGVVGAPRLAKVLVEEGDPISVGQVLAEFDNRPELQADLEDLDAQLSSLSKRIVLQERELARYRNPAASGAVAIVKVEEEQDQLVRLQGLQRRALAQRKGLVIDLAKTQLLSPMNGLVLKLHARVGERPGTDGVMEVGDSQNMQARIEVYESDIARIRLQQPVVLSSENGGFEGQLKGKVVRISPQVEQRSVLSTDPTGDADARVVEVLVQLEPADASRVSRLSGLKLIARFEP